MICRLQWIPDDLTCWGNRVDTHVQIRPGIGIPQDAHNPFIDAVGHMSVCKINQTNGLATGSSIGRYF